MSENPNENMRESASIRLPGPWLDDEMTPAESADFEAFAVKLDAIKSRGPFEKYTESGDITQEYGNAIFELSPYLNSVMHLFYKMAKGGGLSEGLGEQTTRDPIGAVYSFLDSVFDFTTAPAPEPGEQMTLFPEDEKQQRLKNEVLSALPRLQSLIPQKHLIPNNKLANSLTRDIIDVGTVELDVSGRKERELITRCILNYEGDNVKLSSRQPFTEYDRNVADAVTSLYEYGDTSHIITAAQVFRAMVHATETETPSAQQIGAVTKSLDKMRFVRVQIDCSEELTRRKINLNGAQITGGKIDTYLLALEKLEVMAGGQRVTAYKIMKTPILYDYSRLTGQVLTVPAVLLDIRDSSGAKVANTERRIAVKGYLMRRISVMKGRNGARHSKHILYEDTYKNVCEGNPSEKEQRLIREYVDLVLQDWTRQRFIVGYSVLTKGKKKIGVEISLRGQSLGG